MSSIYRHLIGAMASFCLVSTAFAVDYGRTTGSFSVSSSGSATYSVPIWTPPGPNGLTPKVSLDYSSQGGNSLAGVGWNLSAASAIERCPRTFQQDGGPAAVGLSLSDRFCIGGKRLRLGSGTYGAANSVYYTEIADFSRITAYSSQGNGPQYFIVEAKSGLKYEYGNTTDSRVFPGVSPGPIATTPVRWMLNKVYDRSNNTYTISYINTDGFAVPDTISWTPTSYGAGTYKYQAKFNYSGPRTDTDSYIGKIAGFDVANKKRLENIQIKSDGTVVRKYRLAYDTSSVTSRSRLTSAKECADDAETNCFLPITFTYQAGMAGVTAGYSPPPSGSSNSLIKGRYDFNGDGKHDVAYWGGSSWYVVLSANTGFVGPYNTGATAATPLIDAFLPSGRAAIVAVSGGTLWSYRWDDATSSFVSANTGISSAAPATSLDHNGDGLADLVYFTSGVTSLTLRSNTSPASGNPTFANSTFTTAPLPPNKIYGAISSYPGKGLYRSDFNGDGRQDLNVLIVTTGMGGGGTNWTILLGYSGGLDLPPQAQWFQGSAFISPLLNFNSDRCTDRIDVSTIQVSACNGLAASSVPLPAIPSALLDWNADGKTDVLVSGGVYLSTGVGFSGYISTGLTLTGTEIDLDLDGDGIGDVVNANSGTTPFSYWTHTPSGYAPPNAFNVPDTLSGVGDGFGVTHSISYTSTAWSNYNKGAATNYPLQESAPEIVAYWVTSSTGFGNYDTFYNYVGLRTNAVRDESAGFQRVDVTDTRNGTISRRYFEQTFPLTGMLSQAELMQPNGTTPISRVVFTNTSQQLDPTAYNQRHFAYPAASTATQYEVGGTWTGVLLSTVSTTNYFETTGGTLYDQNVTTTEASGANGIYAGGTWSERTYIPSVLNDTTNWCLGRPGTMQQQSSHNLTSGTQISHTTSVTWNAGFCRPMQIIAEPGSGTLQVTKDIGYDSFGNVNSTAVAGIGMATRASTAIYSNGTYTTGQFPLSVTNALNQTSTTAWNYSLGVPTSSTDPNGISTSWQYDAFGRRVGEDRPDGTYSHWSATMCSGCDSRVRTLLTHNFYSSSGHVQYSELKFLDQFDRSIYEYQPRIDGYSNVTSRDYDSLGRVYREYFPYPNNGSIVGYSTFSYDLLNRLTTISRPISDTNSTAQSTDFFYEGLTTRIRDAQSKFTYQTVSAAGWIARSQDHNGYYQAFDYDAFGNPTRVQDSAGNTLQSSTYNLRGMLTQRVDMDMGTWNFTPNALGETVSQTDAKSQTTTFVFDALGRLTSRNEAEGTSTFTFGTSSANKNIGRLASVAGPGYSESYSYDSIGRLAQTAISADTNYQIDYGYNSNGTLDSLTYPVSTASYRLKLKYEYQYGILARISDFYVQSDGFWVAAATDGRGNATREYFGNGLITSRSIDAVTGWVKSIQTGVGGGAGVQQLLYTWDLVGNLSSRKDNNQSGLTETFYYDNLYRLDYSQRSGVTNLDIAYDAMGNISNKSDVGSYTYHATKKHQVTQTTDTSNNSWYFSYDNNGNMTSGRGATYTWTSYNYPASISNGANTSSFSYTPSRQYWRQISNYTSGGAATTIYVGGLLEKVTTSTGTDFRHLIRGGGSNIVVSRQSTGTNSAHYVTSDHLGSSSAITNSTGGILVNSSFDSFGMRRGSNWSGSPSSGDWSAIASTTRRGYTAHTMLDNLALTHMNGRVYDQFVGRFISADPFISEPRNTQNYNRYSYVNNRPLSFTDPSGFYTDTRRDLRLVDGLRSPPAFHVCTTNPLHPPCEPGIHPEADGPGDVGPGTAVPPNAIAAWSGILSEGDVSGITVECDMSPTPPSSNGPSCIDMKAVIDELRKDAEVMLDESLTRQMDELLKEFDQANGLDVIDEKGQIHKAGRMGPPDEDPRYRGVGAEPLGSRPTPQARRDRATYAENQRKRFDDESANARANGDLEGAERFSNEACGWLEVYYEAQGQRVPKGQSCSK